MSDAEPGILLREVARLYTRAQRVAADECRTTNTQCHILTELARSGAQPLGELGQRLCLEKSWSSRAVEALVAEGLVAKKANPDDARSWVVSLTATGRRRAQQLNETLDAHVAQLLESLTSAECAQVTRSLQLILGALRTEAGIAAPGCKGVNRTAAK